MLQEMFMAFHLVIMFMSNLQEANMVSLLETYRSNLQEVYKHYNLQKIHTLTLQETYTVILRKIQ
jgi:hypothetical protein